MKDFQFKISCNGIAFIEVENGFTMIKVCNDITPFSLQKFKSLGLQFKKKSSNPFQHYMKIFLILNDTKNQWKLQNPSCHDFAGLRNCFS